MTHTPRRTIRMSDAEWTAGHTKAQSQGETITEVLRRLLAGYLVDNASGLDYGVEYRAVPKDADSSLAVLQSAESRTLKVGMIPGYSMWSVAVLEALREAGYELIRIPPSQPNPIPWLHREDEAHIAGKGWKCNPIANEVVTAVRKRWVSDWEKTLLRPGERIPDDVLSRMGISYGDSAAAVEVSRDQ